MLDGLKVPPAHSSPVLDLSISGRTHIGSIMASCRYLAIVINGAAAQLEERGDCEQGPSNQLKSNCSRLFRALFRSVILHVRQNPDNSSLEPLLDQWQIDVLNRPNPGVRPLVVLKQVLRELRCFTKPSARIMLERILRCAHQILRQPQVPYKGGFGRF